jgi:hypothetical protein
MVIDWILLAWDQGQLRALVNTVINIRVGNLTILGL